MLVMMLTYTRLQRRIIGDYQREAQVERMPRSRREWAFVLANVLVMVGLLFAPLLALVARAFTAGGEGFTLRYFQQLGENTRNSILFVPPLEAVGNSLTFALTTTFLAVGLGLIAAYLLARSGRSSSARMGNILDALFMLPLATSAVTLGFGFIIAPLFAVSGLRASPMLIPLAHTLVAMPFVVRSVLPALRSIAPSIQEAARVLGATPLTVWRLIDLPLISRGLVVGATFAFTVSMGEFGASLFIARPDTPTMPVAIYRLLSQPGGSNYGQALAMSVLLMAVCGISFVLIERLRVPGMGEF